MAILVYILNKGHYSPLVRPALLTSALGYSLAGLGVPLTPAIAEALYVALVTDTGRFMFGNTDPEAHAAAAELIALGVEPDGIFRRLYEGKPEADALIAIIAPDSEVRCSPGESTIRAAALPGRERS